VSSLGSIKKILPVLGIYAGGIAFFFLLSLVPFLVVVMGLVAYFSPVDLTEPVLSILRDLIPNQDFLNLESIVSTAKQAGSRGLFSLTFLFALWTASNFMGCLTQGLHLIFSGKTQEPQRGWSVRLRSLILILIWSLFLSLTAVLFLVAPVLETWLTRSLDWPTFQTFLITALRFVFLFFMSATAFGLSYRLNARRRTPTGLCWRAGCLTTVGWLLCGWAFTNVLPAIWQKSVAFGALGSVVATMLWAYAAAWVVLLGGLYIRWKIPPSEK